VIRGWSQLASAWGGRSAILFALLCVLRNVRSLICRCLFAAADNDDSQHHARRESRSLSSTSSRRDSMDSTISSSEFDDSGAGDNSIVSTSDTSLSGVDGQSPSEEQAGGDMSPFAIPVAAATKDPVRLKCREMLSAALKTPRKHFTTGQN